jgi:hypothetical protein
MRRFPHEILARCYSDIEKKDKAIAEFSKALNLPGNGEKSRETFSGGCCLPLKKGLKNMILFQIS